MSNLWRLFQSPLFILLCLYNAIKSRKHFNEGEKWTKRVHVTKQSKRSQFPLGIFAMMSGQQRADLSSSKARAFLAFIIVSNVETTNRSLYFFLLFRYVCHKFSSEYWHLWRVFILRVLPCSLSSPRSWWSWKKNNTHNGSFNAF